MHNIIAGIFNGPMLLISPPLQDSPLTYHLINLDAGIPIVIRLGLVIADL